MSRFLPVYLVSQDHISGRRRSRRRRQRRQPPPPQALLRPVPPTAPTGQAHAAGALWVVPQSGYDAHITLLSPTTFLVEQVTTGTVGALPALVAPLLVPVLQHLITRALERSAGDPAKALQELAQTAQQPVLPPRTSS